MPPLDHNYKINPAKVQDVLFYIFIIWFIAWIEHVSFPNDVCMWDVVSIELWENLFKFLLVTIIRPGKLIVHF